MPNLTKPLVRHILLAALLVGVLACRLIASAPTPTPSPAPTPSPTTLPPTSPPPTPVPSPTSAPAIASPTTSVPPIATPEVDWANLSLYQQAMLPEFAADVETAAAAGASRYYLEVELILPAGNAGTPRLAGRERVRYTNTEQVALSEIYFRLYPNMPGYGGKMTVEQVVVDSEPIEPEMAANNSAVRIPLFQPLAPGAAADITLLYQADIPRETEQG
ncbi:MAG: M1 family metallopeptidase, partial [Anaerolineales bacterium]|nr:M1 family metallopeptidase [Anaerolineales bacterium]